MKTSMVAIIAITVLIIGLCGCAMYQEQKECDSRGGKIVKTGETDTIWMNIDGNGTIIPVDIDETKCNK